MIFKFNTKTVYDTVGEIIQHSKQHKNLIQPGYPKRYVRYRLHDINNTFICEHSSSAGGWQKSIKRDMHRLKRGSVHST